MYRQLPAHIREVGPIRRAPPTHHVAGGALAVSKKELRARNCVSLWLDLPGRSVHGMDPLRKRAKLVIRKRERRHAGLRSVPDQISNLILIAASQAAVVQQRRASFCSGRTLAVAARA